MYWHLRLDHRSRGDPGLGPCCVRTPGTGLFERTAQPDFDQGAFKEERIVSWLNVRIQGHWHARRR